MTMVIIERIPTCETSESGLTEIKNILDLYIIKNQDQLIILKTVDKLIQEAFEAGVIYKRDKK